MSVEPLWRRTEPARFRFRFWEDDLTASVFDGLSGETHGLSTLAIELLHLLEPGVATIPALATMLSEVLGGPDPAADLVRDEIHRLQRIGLVEVAP